MDPHLGKIVINRMTRQQDRRLPALEADFTRLDERSFPELLDYAVKVAELVRFYDLRDERDGTFGAFFRADAIVVLASIAATDLTRLEAGFAELERATRGAGSIERKFELFGEVFGRVYELARLVDGWLRGLGSAPAGRAGEAMAGAIERAIDGGLADQLRLLLAYARGAASAEALGRSIHLPSDGLLPIWGAEASCHDASIYRGSTFRRKIDHALTRLDPIFCAFVQAMAGLESAARSDMAAALEGGNHKPHIALYVAFLRLFEAAQRTQNQFSERYVDFYYHAVLRGTFRSPTPDSVYLTFTLAATKGVGSALVPAGTLFSAGVDALGKKIQFASQKPLLVGAGSLACVRTLRVVSGPLLDPPEHGRSWPDVVQRVVATEVAPGTPFATFGEPQAAAEPAIGFAVSSSYLLLSGGSRTVEVGVSYTRTSADLLRPILRRVADVTGWPESDVLRRVVRGAFRLTLSSEKGWLPIEPDGVQATVDLDDRQITLHFQLAADAPPVAAFADGAPSSTLPTLRAYLNQDPTILGGTPPPAAPASTPQAPNGAGPARSPVRVHPLSLLGGLEVEAVWLRVVVSESPDLQLTSAGTAIDRRKPFLPFGPLPCVQSFLDIGCPELFAKTPTWFILHVDWFNLPTNPTGFKGYYQGYKIGLDGERVPTLFDNQSFKVNFQVQRPGRFVLFDTPDHLPHRFDLFQDVLLRPRGVAPGRASTAGLNTLSTFMLDSSTGLQATSPTLTYDPAGSTVRMILVDPPEAFGASIYHQNVIDAMLGAQPDPEAIRWACKDDLQPLVEGSGLVQSALDLCGSLPDEAACRQCYESSLAVSRDTLLNAIVACLTSCAERIPAGVLPDVLERLDDAAEQVQRAQGSGRLQPIGWWLAVCLEVFGVDLGSSLWMATKLWEAVRGIDACEATADALPPSAYAPQMRTGLGGVKKALDLAYADSLSACVQAGLRKKKDLKYPNPPWLPQAQAVSLDYEACCVVAGNAPEGLAGAERAGELFHLLPFGGSRRLPLEAGATARLLPEFAYPANLLLGFTGLEASDDADGEPGGLTLLFDLAPAPSNVAAPVVWEALVGDDWGALPPGGSEADGTGGLRRSGLLTLRLPHWNRTPTTTLPGGYQWLRASSTADADLFPRTLGIYPNALLATWHDDGNTGEHLASPRPPHTVTSAVSKLKNVAAIDQPMESFGGRPPETEATFRIRLGERLRHKERGIASWDYERLVLSRFPAMAMVRTLPARGFRSGDAPGEVLVVVVPGPDGYKGSDSTVPAASPDTLAAIQASLSGSVGPFVQVRVVSPVYVRVEVHAEVEFVATPDARGYVRRLNDELVALLSPWSTRSPWSAAGRDYPSEADLAEFIRTRPYVVGLERIACSCAPDPGGLEWYYLTSATTHQIRAAVPVARRIGY